MAPPLNNRSINKRHINNNKENILQQVYTKYVNLEFVKFLIIDPAALPIVSILILLAELVLNVIVIHRVPYTEIDWIAYMQECEGFLNGTTNYALLKGDTGPLVYPAAFVYIYTILYYITGHGQNIRLGQYIFCILYLLQMWLVLRLYTKSRKVPPYVLVISAFTSYRIHSIYILRLFNDPVAILFLYASLNFFMDHRWSLGSIFFSLGVGVKMNILLFAPALFLFYLINLGLIKTFAQLVICGALQLLLAAPFLLTHPFEYLKGSFDLGRIFEHKWTVNYRFLPTDIFVNKYFHIALLILHLGLLLVFAKPTITFFRSYVRLRALQKQLQPQLNRRNQEIKQKPSKVMIKSEELQYEEEEEEKLTREQESFLKSFEKSLQKSTGLQAPPLPESIKPKNDISSPKIVEKEVSIHFDQCTQLALLPFFVCNFIGIVCARSLHYQFYVWYFHSLPYLVWSTGFSLGLRYLILGLIEFSWNTYPSTNFSSFVLQLCHICLLFGVGQNMYKTMGQSASVKSQQLNHDNDVPSKKKVANNNLPNYGNKTKVTKRN